MPSCRRCGPRCCRIWSRPWRAISRASRTNGALFEVGPRFTGALPGEQVVALAGVRFGAAEPRHWAARPRPVDAIDAKADALAALAALGVKPESVQVAAEAPAWYHPGRVGQPAAGQGGARHLRRAASARPGPFDVAEAVTAFEIDLDAVPLPKARAGKARPSLEPLPYPPVDRDFAFVVADAVRAGDPARCDQGRRPQADPRGPPVRRLCRPGRGRRQQVAGAWRCVCRRPTGR